MIKNILLAFIITASTGFAREMPSSSVPDRDTSSKQLVYKFDIKEQIAPPIWRVTDQSLNEAESIGADLVIIHMNTYGGMLDAADSIRTKILNCPIPVIAFIDNQAISAGALISIACDSIYMRKGASIGAATVVNQQGQAVPDKFQSFMRSTMRSTAESHGKDTIVKGNDTTLVWRRDPKIAESMVDPRLEVEGVIDSGQVLTLTTKEAINVGYCEGEAENVKEVLEKAGIHNYEIKEYIKTPLESIISILVNPAVHGILIMIIIGGIYFELQSPGIGFPLIAAIIAAILYFAPLYLEGLAENWEFVMFLAGIILIGIEIFVIPGFGIAGIAGVIMVVTGLSLSLVDNIVFKFDFMLGIKTLLGSLALVIFSSLFSFIMSLYVSKKLFTSKTFSNLALNTVQNINEGFISSDTNQKKLIGKTGIAATVLRPSGKVEIDNELYDARSEVGYINRGDPVVVIRDEATQLHVIKDEQENSESN